MSGIYIHFPFCKKKCLYCNFFSVASLSRKEHYLRALTNEIEITQDYLPTKQVHTLYWGGGTPSLLSFKEIEAILNKLGKYYTFDREIEFSFEANPEQLTTTYLQQLKSLGINRISIGIQSFNDKILHFLKRSHSAEEAKKAIGNAVSAGFENVSIDLIYGIAYREKKEWDSDLDIAFSFPIQHLSAYSLTVEENTLLYKKIKDRAIAPMEDSVAEKDFYTLLDISAKNGFEQYEISNFAKNGNISKHNSSYWNGTPYLGLGASAHSYNSESRQWNIADLPRYMASMEQRIPAIEKEFLTLTMKYNEYVLLSLRTSSGLRLDHVTEIFGEEKTEYVVKQFNKIKKEFYTTENNRFILSDTGKLWADQIALALFIEEQDW